MQASLSSMATASTSSVASTTVATGPALPKVRFSWIFPADKFASTPSNRDGIPAEEELALRQQAAVFIYELGTNLKVPHYCINTAVVYMHRFYMLNSFKRFTRQRVCAASLFLACKVEECPRTLRDVIENTGKVLRRKKPEELTPEIILQYTDDIVLHENVLLSTLGFSLMVDHPHPIIIKTIQALGGQIQSLPEKTPRELAQTAYYLATKSILLTSFCVKYPPDLIACFCIHLAAAWLKIEIPSPPASTTNATTNGSDTTVADNAPNKRWFHTVNDTFTEKQLGELADEFLVIYEKCPDKIKKKLVYQSERQPQAVLNEGASTSQQQQHSSSSSVSSVASSRPADLADSVVPQGATHVKTESRVNQPPLSQNRPVQPPLPPSSQMVSSDIKREASTPMSYPPSNRPPMPPHHNSSSSSSSSSSARHPPYPHQSTTHYQSHHPHSNNNYNNNNPHSRYPPQQSRPGPPPSNRSSQPPPPNRPSQQQQPLPPPPLHAGDRRHQQPPPHGYDHSSQPPLPPPTSSSSSNRPPYSSQQQPPHGGNHYPNVPMSADSYHQQGPYNRSRPPSLMQGGDKRGYDPSYDPNNPNKRPRPS